MHEGSSNKLETEQEREQEQEQQKEVKARRDQQVEIEKFVDREYSRNEESPTPWPLQALLRPPPEGAQHLSAEQTTWDLLSVPERSAWASADRDPNANGWIYSSFLIQGRRKAWAQPSGRRKPAPR